MTLPKHPAKKRRLILALYPSKEAAQHSIEQLIKDGFVMDEISLIGRVGEGSGDDLLGVSYSGPGERLMVWGGTVPSGEGYGGCSPRPLDCSSSPASDLWLRQGMW